MYIIPNKRTKFKFRVKSVSRIVYTTQENCLRDCLDCLGNKKLREWDDNIRSLVLFIVSFKFKGNYLEFSSEILALMPF